jgi:hypothetical protein
VSSYDESEGNRPEKFYYKEKYYNEKDELKSNTVSLSATKIL